MNSLCFSDVGFSGGKLRISFALTLLALTSGLHAQSAPQTVEVTGSREALPLASATSDVVVIDAVAIEASTADSLEDLLRRAAGLQLSRNGGPGQTASLFVRGNSAASVVVLIDGVRMGSATLGQLAFEGLSLAQVERVEVLRGAASSLWGADAVGGVIRITTRQGAEASRVSAKVMVGSLGSGDVSVGLSGRVGAWDGALSLGREQSRGVSAVAPNDRFGLYNPDRDGYVRNAAHVKLGYTPAVGHRVGLTVLESRLNAQFDGADFLPPNFAADSSADFRNRQIMRLLSADYRGALAQGWTQSLQLARQHDDVQSGGGTVSNYETQRDQLTWQHQWRPTAQQQLVVAFERLKEGVEATGFLQSPARVNHAFVLGWTSTHGAHTLQADARHDRNSVFGAATTGRLGWRMALGPQWALRANAGTAFRAPSFNELYFPGFGVSTVQAERSRNLELGLNWQQANTDASVTVYRNQVRGLIGFEADSALCPADPAYSFGCARNIGRARMQGATLASSHRVGAWRWGGTLDLLDAQNADTGARLTRRAAHQASVRADWTEGAWALGAALVNVGARPEGGATLKAYTLVDVSARWRVNPAWAVEAKVTNLGDVAYQPALDYQAPGRQVWLGLRYNGSGW